MCVLVFRDGKGEEEEGKIEAFAPMLGNTEIFCQHQHCAHRL